MKLKDCIICWTDNNNPLFPCAREGSVPGAVCVMPLEDDRKGFTREFGATSGGIFNVVQQYSRMEAMLFSISLALNLVTQYRCDPELVDTEFKRIDEYCDAWGVLTPVIVPDNLRIFRANLKKPNSEGYYTL